MMMTNMDWPLLKRSTHPLLLSFSLRGLNKWDELCTMLEWVLTIQKKKKMAVFQTNSQSWKFRKWRKGLPTGFQSRETISPPMLYSLASGPKLNLNFLGFWTSKTMELVKAIQWYKKLKNKRSMARKCNISWDETLTKLVAITPINLALEWG